MNLLLIALTLFNYTTPNLPKYIKFVRFGEFHHWVMKVIPFVTPPFSTPIFDIRKKDSTRAIGLEIKLKKNIKLQYEAIVLMPHSVKEFKVWVPPEKYKIVKPGRFIFLQRSEEFSEIHKLSSDGIKYIIKGFGDTKPEDGEHIIRIVLYANTLPAGINSLYFSIKTPYGKKLIGKYKFKIVKNFVLEWGEEER